MNTDSKSGLVEQFQVKYLPQKDDCEIRLFCYEDCQAMNMYQKSTHNQPSTHTHILLITCPSTQISFTLVPSKQEMTINRCKEVNFITN